MAWTKAQSTDGFTKGVDISYGQSPASFNWTQGKLDGIDFVIARATVGYTGTDLSTLRTDTQVVAHTANIKAAGLPIGFYHYASPDYHNGMNDAVAEANYFADTLVTIMTPYGGGYGDLIPFLDIEAPTSMQAGLTGQMIHDWCVEFINAFETRSGRKCGIYTGNWYFSAPSMMNITSAMNTTLKNRPLWVADYYESDGAPLLASNTPVSFGGWSDWTIWQFTGGNTTYSQGANYGGLSTAFYNGGLDTSWGPKSLDDIMPPRQPVGLNANKGADNTHCVVSWTPNTDTDLNGYNVFDYSTGSSVWVSTLGAGATSYTVSGLNAGQAITYKIQAFDLVGDVSKSATINYTAPTSNTFAQARMLNQFRNLTKFRNITKFR